MKNRSHIPGVTHAFLLLSSLAFIGACDNDIDHYDRQVPVVGNYFPTTQGSHWTYERKSMCDGSTVCFTTQQSVAEGEELPWDDSYDPYSSATASFQFVKTVDQEYFGYGYYVPQYKFLDAALPAHRAWVYDNDIIKEEFRITEVNATKVVGGVTYHDVIVVKYTYFVQVRCHQENYEPLFTTLRYYAKGIGEVYMLYTYDYHGTKETFENSLVDYFIAP